MNDKFVERLLREIEKRQALIERGVISGQCSPERYQSMTGEIRGLESAAQIARELIAPTLDRGHPLKEDNDTQRRPQGPAPNSSRLGSRARSFDALS